MNRNPQAGERATLTLPANPDKLFNLAVFIGRFQPFHNGHLHVIRVALERAGYLMVAIGSSNEARRPDHLPFTDSERVRMIEACLTEDERRRIVFKFAEDQSNMTEWTEQIQHLAHEAADDLGLVDPSITLIGHSKDNSSFYLTAFPQWESINVEQHGVLSATPMRENYLSADPAVAEQFFEDAKDFMPHGARAFLRYFMQDPAYANMVAEWDFMKRYLAPYNAPGLFPPKFVTVDNVVIQAGHVLLIQRKSFPGKDLWALPGGHLDDGENIQQASLRELHEETRIKVPEGILRGSIVGEPRVFDNPYRSMRKRTITHATLYHLQPKVPLGPNGRPETNLAKIRAAVDLPKIKAKSDAKQAVWVPLEQVKRDQMFEDHYQIIQTMKARLNPDQ